jgi:Fur family ferric uptake transcriptional regulator
MGTAVTPIATSLVSSGLIEVIDVNLPEELLTQIEQRTGFRIESYTLQLNGRRPLED